MPLSPFLCESYLVHFHFLDQTICLCFAFDDRLETTEAWTRHRFWGGDYKRYGELKLFRPPGWTARLSWRGNAVWSWRILDDSLPQKRGLAFIFSFLCFLLCIVKGCWLCSFKQSHHGSSITKSPIYLILEVVRPLWTSENEFLFSLFLQLEGMKESFHCVFLFICTFLRPSTSPSGLGRLTKCLLYISAVNADLRHEYIWHDYSYLPEHFHAPDLRISLSISHYALDGSKALWVFDLHCTSSDSFPTNTLVIVWFMTQFIPAIRRLVNSKSLLVSFPFRSWWRSG
jgi:hypothetical protein